MIKIKDDNTNWAELSSLTKQLKKSLKLSFRFLFSFIRKVLED
jgi:hypothetical protein